MSARTAWLAAGLIATGGTAMAQDFATRAQAMDYIARTLPKATAANPKYTTQADGTVSQWTTDGVEFATDAAGAVTVTMREHFTQTRDGKVQGGRHRSHFSLADVKVTAFTEPRDVTPSGEASQGVLFTCLKPGCVAAVWGQKPSRADKTDISIQDSATRDHLLAAFRRLQAP